MGKLVFAAIVFVLGYALYVAVRRQRQLLPTTLAEIVPRAVLAFAIGIPALVILFSIFRIIPAGQVGVKVLFGEVEAALGGSGAVPFLQIPTPSDGRR